MIVKFFDDDISGLKHDEKEVSIYLAGPTRWNVHLKSWRKEAVKILEVLEFNGTVFCPEYEGDRFVENYKEKDEWKEIALHSASTIVFWVSKNYPIKIYDSAEFAYWISKKPNSFFYGREVVNSNYEQTFFLNWIYEKELGIEPFKNLEDLMQEAVINATENLVPNGCFCSSFMTSLRKELNGRLINALKSKVADS